MVQVGSPQRNWNPDGLLSGRWLPLAVRNWLISNCKHGWHDGTDDGRARPNENIATIDFCVDIVTEFNHRLPVDDLILTAGHSTGLADEIHRHGQNDLPLDHGAQLTLKMFIR